MELHIDTTIRRQIKLSLLRGGRLAAESVKSTDFLSEELLPFLNQFLMRNAIKLSDIKRVSVNPGPGPFSAVRTGVTVANSLIFALGLKQKLALPKYDRPANITRPKSS